MAIQKAPPPRRQLSAQQEFDILLRRLFAAHLSGEPQRFKRVSNELFHYASEIGRALSSERMNTGRDSASAKKLETLFGKIDRATDIFRSGMYRLLINDIENVAEKTTQQIADEWVDKWDRHSVKAVVGLSPRIVAAMKERLLGPRQIPLSGRVWQLGRVVDQDIRDIITNAVLINGSFPSARKLAKLVEDYVNPATTLKEKDIAELFGDDWRANPIARKLQSRGPAWQAMRLARTEVNHTFHTAVDMTAETLPSVIGVRVVLSETHSHRVPHGDVCDLWAKWQPGSGALPPGVPPFSVPEFADKLGRYLAANVSRQGIYPPGHVPLEHPNGLCSRQMVVPEPEALERLLRDQKPIEPLPPPKKRGRPTNAERAVRLAEEEERKRQAALQNAPAWQRRAIEAAHEVDDYYKQGEAAPAAYHSGPDIHGTMRHYSAPTVHDLHAEEVIREVGALLDTEIQRRIDAKGGASRKRMPALQEEKKRAEKEWQDALDAYSDAADIERRKYIKQTFGNRRQIAPEHERELFNDLYEDVWRILDPEGDGNERQYNFAAFMQHVDKHLPGHKHTLQYMIDNPGRVAQEIIRARLQHELEHDTRYTQVGFKDLQDFNTNATDAERRLLLDHIGNHPIITELRKRAGELAQVSTAADKAFQEAQDQFTVAEREAALEVLREIRPMGKGANAHATALAPVDQAYLRQLNYERKRERDEYARKGQNRGLPNATLAEARRDAKEMLEQLDWASQFYPTDWVEQHIDYVRGAGPLGGMQLGRTARGWARDKAFGQQPQIMLSDGSDSTVPTDPKRGAVAVHEFGHHMENAVPRVRDSEWVIYHRRTLDANGELTKPTSYHGAGKTDEPLRADKWDNEYEGKEYGIRRDSSYELLTMSMQDYFTGTGLKSQDQDKRHWLLGTLATVGYRTLPSLPQPAPRNTPVAPKPAPPAPISPPKPGAPKQFDTNKDAIEWAKDYWRDAKQLTTEQREGFRQYQSVGYQGLNPWLRGIRTPSAKRIEEMRNDMLDPMDAAMNVQRVPETITVYRGVSVDAFPELSDKLVGKRFVEKAYMSTAIGATNAIPTEFKKKQVAMRIEVPPGTPAYCLVHTAPDARMRAEREILLGRGQEFEVTGVTHNKRTGTYEVDVRIIPTKQGGQL